MFWAGDTFAPKLLVKDRNGDDVPIQKFLQDAYLEMSALLARTLGDLDGVLGFEVNINFSHPFNILTDAQMMNEPHRGYIDIQSLHAFDYNTDLHLSSMRE